MTDLDAITAKWLRQCGPCDAGLPVACSHPQDDYRPVMLDLVREVERLQARVAEYEGDDRHVIEFRDDGWTIMHPIACRPNLFGCALNRVASNDIAGPPEEGLGRYHCDLFDGALVVLGGKVAEATDG